MTQKSGDPIVCPLNYVASNGVTIAQIAYALAIVEGMITIGCVSRFGQPGSGIGLN